MPVGRFKRCAATLIALPVALAAQSARYSFSDAQSFLKTHCLACHQPTAPAAGFDIQQIASPATLRSAAARWNMLALRVRNGEMPPKGAPVPPADQRAQFVDWATASVRTAGCAADAMPTAPPIRRLNRDEYAATIRDLLDIQMNPSKALPADGAGGEGFDNAGETLFLSPLLSEKYLQAAKFAMDVAAKEYKSRERTFAGLVLLSRDVHRKLRGLQVLLREERGQEQRLPGIVEALAACAIGRQRTGDVDLDIKQVANRSGILVPIQPADRRSGGRRVSRAAGSSDRCSDPVDKLCALIGGRHGGALRRHLSVPHTQSQHVPACGRRSKSRGGGNLLDVEAGGRRRGLVAGQAMRFQEAL